MTGYKVVTEALRAEAPKWDEFAVAVKPVQAAVQNAYLESTAFFCGSPFVLGLVDLNAEIHKSAYEGYRIFMDNVLTGALEELPQVAEALVKVAEKYEEAEDLVSVNLDEIWDAAKW